MKIVMIVAGLVAVMLIAKKSSAAGPVVPAAAAAATSGDLLGTSIYVPGGQSASGQVITVPTASGNGMPVAY